MSSLMPDRISRSWGLRVWYQYRYLTQSSPACGVTLFLDNIIMECFERAIFSCIQYIYAHVPRQWTSCSCTSNQVEDKSQWNKPCMEWTDIGVKLTEPGVFCPEKANAQCNRDESKLLQLKECSSLSQNAAGRIEKFQRQQEERYRRCHWS